MQSDPLSDFLLSLSAKSTFFTGLYAGGEWAISFPAPEGFKFNTVRKGSCWLTVENTGDPVFLHEGDCFLLSRQRAFTLGSGPDVKTINAQKVYCNAVNGIARYGTEEDFYLVGGRFEFNEDMSLISELLPPVLIIRRNAPQADALHWSLEKLANELAKPQHGSALINSDTPVFSLGQAFGYDSDSAFSHAFRRIKGLTPSEYRKTMRLKTMN